jgi:hypothetical protein
MKTFTSTKHVAQIGRVRHIPTGNIGLERCAAIKHITQIGRAAGIPIGKVGTEGTATTKHSGKTGPISHVPSGQIFIEIPGLAVSAAIEHAGKVVHSGYVPVADRIANSIIPNVVTGWPADSVAPRKEFITVVFIQILVNRLDQFLAILDDLDGEGVDIHDDDDDNDDNDERLGRTNHKLTVRTWFGE